MGEGSYFPLAVKPHRSAKETYGISLVPVPIELNSSDVPKVLKTSLSSLFKKREKHLAGSGMKPNLWIVSVKVLQVKGESPGKDIRD